MPAILTLAAESIDRHAQFANTTHKKGTSNKTITNINNLDTNKAGLAEINAELPVQSPLSLPS